MVQTEAAAPASSRPRPWLLVALAVTVALALAVWMWPGSPAGGPGRPSNARPAASGGTEGIDPASLDVRLEALEPRDGVQQAGDRNPFRFQPRPQPAPPPPPVEVSPVPRPVEPAAPAGPPPPPPIAVKFIGILEPRAGDRVAVFSDCRITTHAREGGVVLGQYRLVSIGVESVVMEYLDGRGRATIRLQGQECVGK